MKNILVDQILDANHYLGKSRRCKLIYQDEAGVLIFSSPASRMLPKDWLELSRWCITLREKNSGSKQWALVVGWLKKISPETTTIVSYSDPSAGHTGALYRACNWFWAPTWHRLRPPPSGLGAWDGRKAQAVKDRRVFTLLPDPRREGVLSVKDAAIFRKFPFANYKEPKFRGLKPIGGSGGGDFARWNRLV